MMKHIALLLAIFALETAATGPLRSNERIRRQHQANLENFGGLPWAGVSASTQASAPVSDQAPVQVSAPAKDQVPAQSFGWFSSPSNQAPPSAPPPSHDADLAAAQRAKDEADDAINKIRLQNLAFLCTVGDVDPNQSSLMGVCPQSNVCPKVDDTLAKIAPEPAFKQPPPPPTPNVSFKLVNVSVARKPYGPEPKRGHYPVRKPEIKTNKSIPGLNISPANVTEPTTEPVLDYIYHLLVTFLVVFVGFGFRIRHLMAPWKTSQTTREQLGAQFDASVSTLPGYSTSRPEDIALQRACFIAGHLAMQQV